MNLGVNLEVLNIVNLFINKLALGFMAIAFISHYIGIFKRDDRYFRLAKPLILIALVLGTIQTIVYFYFLNVIKNGIPNFWVLINKLQPGIIGNSMITLLIFLILGAIYYYGFSSSNKHQGWNVFIGIMAFVFGFASDTFYTIAESYTISPNIAHPISTPMVLDMIIEKNIEIFALSAAILALWAGIRYIMASKQSDKEYYDWLGSFSSIITVLFLVIYPVIYFGWLKHLRAASSTGFNRIMLGNDQWIMYVFMGTVGGALILNYIYMLWKLVNGRDKTRPTVSVGLIFFLIIVGLVSLGFGMLPPTMGAIGNMQPVKYIALSGLFITGFLVLGYYLKDLTPNFKFGSISKLPQVLLILSGLCIAVNVPVMGYMKVSARGTNSIIYQTMNLDGTKYVAPVVFPWPVKKGFSLLTDKCVKCHTLARVEKYNGKSFGGWDHTILHQMKDVNAAPITVAEGKEIANYLKSLNIIAYNKHMAKEHTKWVPPVSLPWNNNK